MMHLSLENLGGPGFLVDRGLLHTGVLGVSNVFSREMSIQIGSWPVPVGIVIVVCVFV